MAFQPIFAQIASEILEYFVQQYVALKMWQKRPVQNLNFDFSKRVPADRRPRLGYDFFSIFFVSEVAGINFKQNAPLRNMHKYFRRKSDPKIII